jgi:hypothetical protein
MPLFQENSVESRRTTTLLTAAILASLLVITAAPAQERRADPPPVFPVAMGGTTAAFTPGAVSAPVRQSMEVTPPAGRKSVGLAVIYSLLLPGMGELYAGSYGSGKYFTGAEGVLWLTLGGVDMHARSMRDDARTYAALHAGFDPSGKDDTYFINVGNFNDVYAYNEQVLRDRDAYKLYDPLSSAFWKWDSDVNRGVYREQRVAAEGMFNNTRFVVAALAVNRVLSAINAARLVISGNREAAGAAIDIGARVLGGPFNTHGIALSVTRVF